MLKGRFRLTNLRLFKGTFILDFNLALLVIVELGLLFQLAFRILSKILLFHFIAIRPKYHNRFIFFPRFIIEPHTIRMKKKMILIFT